MAQASAPVPPATTEAHGKWLADQDWNFDTDGHFAWVLNGDRKYLAEGVTEDSEGKCVSNEEMQEAMQLMQHAPRLLRFVLRGLELLDNATTNDSTKVEHVRLLLHEAAVNSLRGKGDWLDVARAIKRRQASRK